MRRAAMARCLSWSAAAVEYEALYRRLIGPQMVAVQPKPRAAERPAVPAAPETLEPAA
jgi:hypothetical protein